MDFSEYILEPLREDKDFTLYRGRHRNPDQSAQSSLLLMAPSPHRALFEIRQAAHESSSSSELGTRSYVCPTALAQYYRGPVLVLENAEDELLDALVEKPTNTGHFFRISLEEALEQMKRSDGGFGQTLDFVQSHPDAWMVAVHPKDRETASRTFWDGVHSGQGFGFETRSLRAKDGVYRWHVQQAVVLRNAQGEVLKFVGTTTDIDDEKRAEEALRESEADLRRVIDNIPGLVSTLGPDGETQLVNGQILEYFGKTAEELKNWRLGNAIHPDDLPRVSALHAQSIKRGVSFGSEYRLRRFDGVYFWFEFRAEPIRDGAGSVSGWYVLATDIHERKLAEEALKASERKFASIIDTIPTLAWSARPDGYCDFLSQGWLDFTGLTLEQAQGFGWSNAIHPEDRQTLVQTWQSALASGMPVDTEARLRRFDGVYRWTLIRGNPWRDESGSIAKWYGTNTDIDDRKHAEEALRASEANLRRVIDTIPTLSWCNLADGPNEFLSKSWHDYTGLSTEEARGWGWSAAFHPDDLPPLMKRWQELLVSGDPGEIEARLRRYDGEYRWFLIRVAPFRDESGVILRWYGTSTDIHDRKLADEALRASENNFRQILDSIPGLVCTMDPMGEIQHLNQPLLDYFGKTPPELRGWKMSDSVHPDDLPEVINSYTHSITTGAPYAIEHRCRRVDGAYRWFQVRASAVRNADGHITGWYVLLTDIEDRKRAEDALRASETNLREILDSIPGLVCTLSPTGAMELTNRPFLQYFGKALEEMQDWGNSDAVHPDDMPGVLLEFTNSITTGAPYYTEHRCRRADGVYRWFQNSARPIRDTEGRITRWYCLITDIDDRKRAEDELKRSEARHRVVVETASDAVVSIDESGVIILANPATQRIFGYNPAELIGKPLTVLMPGGIRQLHESGFKRFLETGVKHLNWQGAEMAALRASGEEFPAEVSFGEMTVDQRTVFTGFIRDISDKKRAEEAIRASERKLSLIINTMPVLTWSALPDGAAEFFNQRWLDYTGLLPEQAQGWGWAEAFHHDDLGRVTEYYQSMIASGRSGEIEARFRRFDGEYRWFLFRADPMRDESGAIVKWYGTNTDIDDRKRAEEELTRARAELAHVARVTSLGVLTASIAHEVNQPLSGIVMNAGTCLRMLNSDPPNIEGARETARRTIRDGNRASEVVTRLRALFKRKEIAAELVNLNDAALEVIALYANELQSKRIIVRNEFAENLPSIKGDRIQLQQVIENLLRNASDSMSSIDDRPRQLLIRTETDDDMNVQVTVQDSGIGIDPEAIGRLFDAFYTTKEDGTGIGLSVSRSIVEAHRGQIWAVTNNGPGSSFLFSIPCDPGSIQSQGE